MSDRRTGPALVTGAGGFAGRHLLRLLQSAAREPSVGREPSVPGASRGSDPAHAVIGAGHNAPIYADFRVQAHIEALLERFRPAVVYHLAGISTPAEMQRDPVSGNAGIVQPAILLMEAMLRIVPDARLLLVSTYQVYGRPSRLPLDEDAPLAPTDLYGSARAAVEYMVRSYRERGLDVVIARAFPHTGPGRDRRCVTGDWAARLAAGELRIPVPDLSVRRDWSDVRDVVAGYRLLASSAPRNSTIQLCSGEPRPLADLFSLLTAGRGGVVSEPGSSSPGSSSPAAAPAREIPSIFGSPARARDLGWSPRYTLQQTIGDLRQWALDPEYTGEG